MLHFEKNPKTSPMGMKINFKIQKIDQILPDFWKVFEKLDKIVYWGTIFFSHIF